jgi:hypothetical protein
MLLPDQCLFRTNVSINQVNRSSGALFVRYHSCAINTKIAGAIDTAHSNNLALRCLDPSKVLTTGQNRFRVSGCGVLDLLLYSIAANAPSLMDLFQTDLIAFGHLMLVYGTPPAFNIQLVDRAMRQPRKPSPNPSTQSTSSLGLTHTHLSCTCWASQARPKASRQSWS